MLADIIEYLTTLAEQVVMAGGVPGIMLIAFMENIFPPTPSEFLYPLAGKLAYDGVLNLPAVMLAGAGGSMLGAITFYQVGRWLGEERARLYIARWGTVRVWRFTLPLVTVEAYDKAMTIFARHGGIVVMVARSVPLVHGVISIPAGVVHMNRLRFLAYTFIGVMLWIVPTVMMGYLMGSQWEDALEILNTYETLWYIVIALVIMYWLVRRWRRSSRYSQTLSNESSKNPEG